MTTETKTMNEEVTVAEFDLELDFDFETSQVKTGSPAEDTPFPQVNTRIFYKGRLIHEGELSADMQASAVIQAAVEYSGLPKNSNYGLYLKKPSSDENYVFCPPSSRIDAVCKDNGIALDDPLTSLEMEVAPELVGA